MEGRCAATKTAVLTRVPMCRHQDGRSDHERRTSATGISHGWKGDEDDDDKDDDDDDDDDDDALVARASWPSRRTLC